MNRSSVVHFSLFAAFGLSAFSWPGNPIPVTSEQGLTGFSTAAASSVSDLGTSASVPAGEPIAIPTSVTRPPSLIVDEAGNSRPMVVERVSTEVVIRGLLAETTLTMTFRNPHDRVLEGELLFPLPEGSTVSGYGLDIKGELVEGVIVEKHAARIAFEKEVRKRVDPGVVEWVRGNNFRTRVYPIPAQGTRTVLVRYVSQLLGEADQAVYQLPLNFDHAIPDFEIKVAVVRSEFQPETEGGLANFEFERWEDQWVASASMKNAVLTEDLRVALPRLPEQLVSVEQDGEDHVFVIHDSVGVQGGVVGTLRPKRALLYWDASLSRDGGVQGDLEFLEQLLSRWKRLHVDLVVFRDRAEEPKRFSVTGGSSPELITYLTELPYDGGTDLAGLSFPQSGSGGAYDLHLLFTDGMGNVGRRFGAATTAPLFTVATDSSANHVLLRHLAEGSGGAHINLTAMTREAAMSLFSPEPFSFLGAEFGPGTVSQIHPSRRAPAVGRVHVSGRLLVDSTTVQLLYGRGGKVLRRIPVMLSREGASDTGLVGRFWAQQEVTELSLDPRPDTERILNLGRRYGIVTPGTSLLVLETLEQHLEHDVRPPGSRPEILETWLARKAAGIKSTADLQRSKIDEVVTMWQARVQWWKTDPAGWKEKKKNARGHQPEQEGRTLDSVLLREDEAVETVGESNMTLNATGSGFVGGGLAVGRVAGQARREQGMAQPADDRERPPASGPSITVQPWDPKTPYMAALKAAAKKGKAYETYLAQRPGYEGSPSYFLDCANYFYGAGNAALGRRVLSSILDLKLDDPSLLRVVGYRLGEAQDLDLAVVVLEQVLALRPEEPQSYRDLALILSQRAEGPTSSADRSAGQIASDLGRAMSLLHQVVMGRWDRFPEIEVIALMELNRLLWLRSELPKNVRAGLEVPALDNRLKKLLDVDVRISLVWDADLTDIDLWIIEPTGEKVFYSNPRSAIGGLVSRDFTRGYGPEEYVLRNAVPGKYTIQANYYGSSQQSLTGPATVKAVVFTDYGRPTQQRQELTLRLKSVKEVVTVGTIELDGSGTLLAPGN